MRRLAHLFLALFGLGLLLSTSIYYWLEYQNRELGDQQILDERFARRTVFSLEKDHWLEFPISGFHDRLRISSFAMIDGNRDQFLPDQEFLYAIDYQVLNESAEVLLEKKYHLRSFLPNTIIAKPDITKPGSTEDGALAKTAAPATDRPRTEQVEPKFIPQHTAVLTASRFFDVDLSTLDQPRSVRMRIADKETVINEILVRPLMRGRLTADKARLRWARLSEDKKRKVTRQYIYPHTLLHDSEIKTRLSQRWYPTAPSDTRFTSHILYSFRSDNDEVVYEDVPVRIGRAFGGELLLTALIPKSGTYRLFFQSVDGAALPPVAVTLRHWDPDPRIATEEILQMDPGQATIERQFGKGMIELRSPVLLRAAITSEHAETKHINKVYSASAYQLDAKKPVIYDIARNPGQASALRISVRQAVGIYGSKQANQAIPHATSPPHYRVLDRDDKVLLSGKLSVNPLLSPYGRLIGHNATYHVSESQNTYLPLPDNASRIEIYGSPELFTYAYLRPTYLPVIRVIPRDYRAWEHLGGRTPSWFLMTAFNDLDLALSSRRNRLYSQPTPPVVDEQISAGFFSVREIQPRGDVWGKYILASLAYDKQPRVGADKLYFAEIPKTGSLTLTAPPGIATVAPGLLFHRRSETPETIAVRIDGKLLDHYPVSGRSGLIRLPPIKVGAHNIQIGGDQTTRWYINQCDCRYTYQRRFAYKFINGVVEFDIRKTSHEDEIITLLAFTDSQGAPADLQTELLGFSRSPTPSTSWSFKKLQFAVRPDTHSKGGFELDFAGRPVGNPERLFIRLGADIAPGTYRLRVRQTGGPEALIQAYKLEATSGISRFFTELL